MDPTDLLIPTGTRTLRDNVLRLEAALQEIPHLSPEEINALTRHHFANGTYVREFLIPAGHCVVGKIHRHEHFTFIMSGDVIVQTEDGPVEMSGPRILVTQPGTKRAIFAVTDSLWVTVHLNPKNERDLAKLEQTHIAPSFASLDHVAPDLIRQEGSS